MKNSLALVFLVFSAIICSAQDSRYSFKENYDLGPSARVSISSSDGDIEVVGMEGSKTDIFYIVKKNGRLLNISRAELEKEVDLQVVQAANSLNIVVKYRNEFRVMDWKEKMVVSFRIQVPTATACNLKTSDGNISARGLTKDQDLKTSDGNIEVAEIQGSVMATTSDGNIRVKKVGGDVDAKTSDGDIEVAEIKGNTEASTSDGNISLTKISGATFAKTSDGDIRFADLNGSLTAKTSDGNVSGNLLQLTKELNVNTSDGNISVTIPSKLGLDLHIKGESLDVPLANFSGKSDENSIDGKSNGGGIPVNISTSGHVRLIYN
ncbi:MAG: DUF4097 family beta strand repeat-containing protein [Chryseolinea sp.]